MDLAIASQWAEVLGLVTIFGAAIYSWLTINEIKKDRKASSSLKLSELWQNKDFSHGSISIWMQPDDLKTFAELEEFHGEDYPKVFTVLLTWESIAITLHDGHFDFDVVRKQFSLSMITAWKKNRQYGQRSVHNMGRATGVAWQFPTAASSPVRPISPCQAPAKIRSQTHGITRQILD